jgi:hypothetical protein
VLSLLDFEWDMKFYFLHINFDEVGTTLKHPETINGNVKNLSKRLKRKDKDLSKTLIANVFGQTLLKKIQSCMLVGFSTYLIESSPSPSFSNNNKQK